MALKALFFLDINPKDATSDLEAFCAQNQEALTETVKPFFMEIVQGVREGLETIDDLLNRYSKNWKLSRMPVVDRNIMRMAVFELLNCPDIPASVTINEAVEIGKKYGTRDSGAFINGVLDRIKAQQGSG